MRPLNLGAWRPGAILPACICRFPYIHPVQGRIPAPKRHCSALRIMTVARNANADITGDLERDIDASTAAIDEMVREVTKNLFIDIASAYVTGEAATKEGIVDLVRAAVSPRLDSLNGTFLPIVNSYIEAVSERGEADKDILGVLLAIKAEVLKQLADRLPPEMRTIQKALEASGSDERMVVLREATAPDAASRIDPGALALTVARMIQDFEGENEAVDEVPDRRLLARLCLLREELRELSDEAQMGPGRNINVAVPGSTSGIGDNAVPVEVVVDGGEDITNNNNSSTNAPSPSASPYTTLRGVPAREVAFLKELMNVSSSEKRRAVLEGAFRGDVASVGLTGSGIRPGAFIDCVKALQAEMTGPVFSQTNQNAGGSDGVLMRLEDIWREAIVVLEDVGEEAEYSP